ncbi:MAG: hypothetical protein WDW38_011025 [Sanguina aurantia]
MGFDTIRSTFGTCLVFSALLLLTPVHSAQQRVLVLLHTLDVKSSYSGFFSALEAQGGLQLEYRSHKDSSLRLREYGVWQYEHLILLTPKAEGFGGAIDAPTILEFVDAGRNLLIAASSDVSELMRTLATEVGVDLDDKGTKVFDHFNYATFADGTQDHTAVLTGNVVQSAALVGAASLQAPVLFRGIASAVAADAELVTVVLSASSTAYSHDPRKAVLEPPLLLTGQGASLVSAVQARNNARVVVAGSLELFSDEFFDAQVWSKGAWSSTANRAFTSTLALWCFQQRGVLRATNFRHHHIGSDEQPATYRVSDDVEVLVDVVEINGGVETPFRADDIQIEFTMLDPHIRLPLVDEGNGTFSLAYKVPDVYGVFKYVIDYRHLGYSYIEISHQVPVRPFKHNEYERFLTCAFPYYASAGSTMAAFFLLGFFYLYVK